MPRPGSSSKGIHEGIAGGGYKTLAEYDTPDWAPSKAQQWASGQISRFGKKIVGVVAANDGTAGGAIAAFKAAGVNPVPPVTGNDATIAGLQLIIAGDQYNTILKPSEIVAAAAARRRRRAARGAEAQIRHDAVQHADAALHADADHREQPQGGDRGQDAERQADRARFGALHGPLRGGLQEARHHALIRRRRA